MRVLTNTIIKSKTFLLLTKPLGTSMTLFDFLFDSSLFQQADASCPCGMTLCDSDKYSVKSEALRACMVLSTELSVPPPMNSYKSKTVEKVYVFHIKNKVYIVLIISNDLKALTPLRYLSYYLKSAITPHHTQTSSKLAQQQLPLHCQPLCKPATTTYHLVVT
jgi:hypothetical protein